MVLAAQGLAKEADALSFAVDGVRPGRRRSAARYRAAALESPVAIANAGHAPVQVVVTVSGNPDRRRSRRRRTATRSSGAYHRLDGSAVEPPAASARTTASWWC